MSTLRIALANLRYAASPAESVELATEAVARAGAEGARVICFPECYIPGYRGLGKEPPAPDQAFLEQAWEQVQAAAAQASVSVILGAERIVDGDLRISALVIDADGTRQGFQYKVQLDPSEEGLYSPGQERRVFEAGPLTFGVSICHEGWRYPETVRWAAQHGAQVVFHPHYEPGAPAGFSPTGFADPRNSFHEKAALCRAAENTCYFASVNYATSGSATTSAVVSPDGTLLCSQPYGEEGVLLADIDLSQATGLLARRFKGV